MKTMRMGIVVLGVFLNGGASAEEQRSNTVWDGFSGFLQPEWERDFSATIGVKVWVNEWERSNFLASFGRIVLPDGSGAVATLQPGRAGNVTSEGVEPTPIPQLSIRYRWLVLSGSYYPKTEFEYGTTFDDLRISAVDAGGNVTSISTTTRFNTTTSEREEWDAALGILILPNVAILGGYKKIDQDIRNVFTSDVTLDGVPLGPANLGNASLDSDLEIKGPTIGIAGSAPIARGFGLYGSYAHGFMDVDIQNVDVAFDGTSMTRPNDGDADYDVVEVGFTYTHGTKEFIPFAPLSAATVYAGYRWQHIETDIVRAGRTVEDERTDTTRGFVAGVNLSF